MEKAQVLEAIKQAKENSTKRNFKQTFDLMINLKEIDLKKQDNRVDIYSQLHFQRGKKTKICGLVGAELSEQSKKFFDTTIIADDFKKFSDKKAIKKLAKEHDFFVAQANVMPQVASTFGRVLGPRGRMPSPKAGCVVPPNANLEAVAKKLQKTVKIKIETSPLFQTHVGNEDTKEEEVADNVITIYKALSHALPNDIHNIKNAFLKLTMGVPVKIGGADEESAEDEKPKAEKKEEAKEEKEGHKAEEKSQDAPKEEIKEEETPKEAPAEETPKGALE